MNEKTAQQIARMKEQTIGVEVEMNHITREKAARIAADFFGKQIVPAISDSFRVYHIFCTMTKTPYSVLPFFSA